MRVITLDFESFFDSAFTLKKLSTESYCRDARFKAHMVGLKYDRGPTSDYLPQLLGNNEGLRKQIRESAVLCHHAHFDGLILSHVYDLKPAFWFDTLSMARLALPRLRSHSLESLATYFGLPSKTVPYNLFRGVQTLGPDLYRQVAEGCRHDVDLTREIFDRLLPYVPKDEIRVIDQTVRMFTEPCLRLDRPRLEAFHAAEVVRKEELMFDVGASLGVPDALGDDAYLEAVEVELQSSAKFKQALEAIGYECPMKPSPTGNGDIPALAKTDDGMKDLLNSEDSRVSALAAARLGVKSTLNETRALRLLETDARGPLPVDLKYCGAHTTRWSGSGALNWQNFPRGGEIRKAILAPEGYQLVIVDLSQIEYRLLCWLTGQTDKLDALRAKRDLYCEFASKFYGYEITKADPARRGVGKQGTLQCGYGAGAGSIIRTAAGGGYGPPVKMTEAEGLGIRDLYRREHPCVVEFWKACDRFLALLASGGEGVYKCLEIADQRIYLPNGTALDYEGLEAREGEWQWPTRKGWARLWGSKITADICQALARAVIAAALVTLSARLRIALTVHDEIVALAPTAEAPAALAWALGVMRTPPPWAPDVPLDADGLCAPNYAK